MIHLALEIAAFLFLAAIAVCVMFLIFAMITSIFDGICRSVDMGRSRRTFERQQAADYAARAERQQAVRAEIARHTLPTHKGKPIEQWRPGDD